MNQTSIKSSIRGAGIEAQENDLKDRSMSNYHFSEEPSLFPKLNSRRTEQVSSPSKIRVNAMLNSQRQAFDTERHERLKQKAIQNYHDHQIQWTKISNRISLKSKKSKTPFTKFTNLAYANAEDQPEQPLAPLQLLTTPAINFSQMNLMSQNRAQYETMNRFNRKNSPSTREIEEQNPNK